MNKKIVVAILLLCVALSMGCIDQPKYIQVKTIEIDNVGDGAGSIIIYDVYNYNTVYTGSDFWGYKTYNVDVSYYVGSTKCMKTYTGINSIDVLQVYEKRI